MKNTFAVPEMIILSRKSVEVNKSPESPYHRCLNACCFMD